MTRPFDITPQTDTPLTLDASGQGKKIFNVTNKLSTPLRGTLRAFGVPPEQNGWYQVDGEIERDFPTGDRLENVVVNVKLPPGTAPGKYRMRLDAYSSRNPEEDFTQGPEVGVVLPAPLVEKEGKGIPWWVWVVIAVVLLLIAGLGTWLVLRQLPAKTDDGGGTTTGTPAPTTQDYDNPQINGVALDLCREWGTNCGKPAADAFCVQNKWDTALHFTFVENKPPTVVISGNQTCNDASCDRIDFIQCGKNVKFNPAFTLRTVRGRQVMVPLKK